MASGDYDNEEHFPAKSDAYTGVLFVSLLALIAGAAFLYLDWQTYEGKSVPTAEKLDLDYDKSDSATTPKQ